MSAPRRIVLMGVTGCGKTTVGRLLAAALGGTFLDGDDLHPPANIAKMRHGEPLDDEDRWPWLDRIRQAMKDHDLPGPLVVACSALKESYRRRLGRESYDLVFLRGAPETIAARLTRRSGHFMPASLLESQLAALEPPAGGLIVEIEAAPAEIVSRIVAGLGVGLR